MVDELLRLVSDIYSAVCTLISKKKSLQLLTY
jgi:hypothetical protein